MTVIVSFLKVNRKFQEVQWKWVSGSAMEMGLADVAVHTLLPEPLLPCSVKGIRGQWVTALYLMPDPHRGLMCSSGPVLSSPACLTGSAAL